MGIIPSMIVRGRGMSVNLKITDDRFVCEVIPWIMMESAG